MNIRDTPVAEMVGTRVGMLTINSVIKIDRHYRKTLLVRCDCGTEKEVLANSIRSGATVSCGCVRKEKSLSNLSASRSRRQPDLTGRRFHRLVVVGMHERTKTGTLWRCLCDCGNTRLVRTSKLQNGEHKSCGCYRAELMAEHLRTRLVRVVNGQKKCHKCHRILPTAMFSTCKRTHSGLAGRCRDCASVYEAKSRFGVSTEEAAMLVQLRGAAICEACNGNKKVQIDHCHADGKVRGFLCGPCNRALGLLKDDHGRLRGLIKYLEKYNKTRPFRHGGKKA